MNHFESTTPRIVPEKALRPENVTEQNDQSSVDKIIKILCQNGAQLALQKGGNLASLANDIFTMRYEKNINTVELEKMVTAHLDQNYAQEKNHFKSIKKYLLQAIAAIALVSLEERLFKDVAAKDIPIEWLPQIIRLRQENPELRQGVANN